MAQTIDLNSQSLRRNISQGLRQSMQRAGLARQPSKKLKSQIQPAGLLSH